VTSTIPILIILTVGPSLQPYIVARRIREVLTMRFLKVDYNGELIVTKDEPTRPAPYAILSHTWGAAEDEVTFEDIEKKTGKSKVGYAKLWLCADQARKDGLDYCWVDTCCINKASRSELSEAITSMFCWYQDAAKCYLYLSDVSVGKDSARIVRHTSIILYL
jgi:hypothetical protein